MFPIIHVYLDPHQFTFENPKHETFTLRTIIYVIEYKGGWRLAGIEPWENKPPTALTIDLFENNHPIPNEINKLGLLQSFMDYGISKCLSKTIIPGLRPTVILHDINRFQNILNGYEKGIFGNVTLAAGARKVMLDMNTIIAER